MSPAQPDEKPRLITTADVMARTSFSRSTLSRLIRRKAFPEPIRFGINRLAWREAEVTSWIESR
jgi:predicted DNA-binding transcriptional regulator AlpA